MSTPRFSLVSRFTVTQEEADFIVAQGVQHCLKTPEGTVVVYRLGKNILIDKIIPVHETMIEDLHREMMRLMSIPKDILAP